MSDYETESDSDGEDLTDSFRDSFACLSKVKSNTPRARFDVHFYPEFIRLIQFTAQQKVSHRYTIEKDNVIEMFRLPYSTKQAFFVVHLKRPIVGGNRATTEYNFVVFNFTQEDYEEVTIQLDNPIVRDMFDEDVVDAGMIEGTSVEILETILTKVFAIDATTPSVNYDGHQNAAQALRCTFWDNDEHFLYPLDDGFVNVWKYCQRLNLRDIQNVRFVRSQGRSKTFDFYIHPILKRSIRRYHIGAGKSNTIDCFYLEFKAIDLDQYDGLFEYCSRNKITISTNDFQHDTDGSSSESGSQSQTETNASDSDSTSSEIIDDGFEAPDPYLARLQAGQQSSSHSGTGESTSSSAGERTSSTSEDELVMNNREATPPPSKVSSAQKRRFRRISRNVITDESESSSSDSMGTRRKRKSFRIESDDDGSHIKTATATSSLIDDDSGSG